MRPVLGALAPLGRVLAAHPAQGGPSASCKHRKKCPCTETCCANRRFKLVPGPSYRWGQAPPSISSRTESRMLCPHGNDSLTLDGFCCGLFAGCLPSPRYGPGASAPDPTSLTAGSPPWSQPVCTRPGQAPGAQLAPAWHHCRLSRSFLVCPPRVPGDVGTQPTAFLSSPPHPPLPQATVPLAPPLASETRVPP